MKKILLSACILATTGCMVSCIDDDNNYNYSKVNEIEGGTYNFKNISENYNLSIGQEVSLYISPVGYSVAIQWSFL